MLLVFGLLAALSLILVYAMFRRASLLLSMRKCCFTFQNALKLRGWLKQPPLQKEAQYNADKPISSVSSGGKIKLVIYDFDQTLSCEHIWNATQGCRVDTLNEVSDDDLMEYFGNRERVARLQTHLKFLKAKKVEFRILSHGWEDVILGCFERLEKLGHLESGLVKLEDIGGRETLRNFHGHKQICIQQWIKERGLTPQQVIFVDDDPTNIDAVAASDTCETYQVEGHGLTPEDLTHLESRL